MRMSRACSPSSAVSALADAPPRLVAGEQLPRAVQALLAQPLHSTEVVHERVGHELFQRRGDGIGACADRCDETVDGDEVLDRRDPHDGVGEVVGHDCGVRVARRVGRIT